MPQLTLSSVEKKIAALQKVAEKLKKKDKAPAIRAILAQMQKHGVTLDDLRSAGKTGVVKKQPRKRPSVAAKYRHPETGTTWSGRGRTPVWLAEAQKAGQSRDSFKILTPN